MKKDRYIVRTGGRPLKDSICKRTAEIKIRCLDQEKEKIRSLSKMHGLNMSDYILKAALDQKTWGNYKELHAELHRIGTEFSRAGNNINQLAKHANALNKIGRLDKTIIEQLNLILTDYVKENEAVRIILRKIVRELTK
ncbi:MULTISPECIES: plasmid mobilization protein [Sphingobacterium]|uniref:plasmid mobilization protein n=1 Tax=Sphingobacterium TaxID=28453 RepID=UPI00258109D0|nr:MULTISPECIES: hypothetical protein [Sphingobacterium]